MKSELAALDRKIQLELAPPTPEVQQQAEDGKKQEHREAEKPPALTEHLPPQIRNPDVTTGSPVNVSRDLSDRIIIGRPGSYVKDDNRPKGMKI